jgi:hypothetical protein
MGGVRDAAVIQLATPELTRPRARVTLRVAVFFRALRAAAWASLLDHEFGLRDPRTGTAQLRVSGADDVDRVWVTQPGDASGGEATVIGARGPVAFQLQAQTQLTVPLPPDSGSTPELLDLSARAERIVRQAAADWTAWLERQPSLRPR